MARLSNFLFEFQVVRASKRSTIEGPLYLVTKLKWNNFNKDVNTDIFNGVLELFIGLRIFTTTLSIRG